MQPFEAIVAEHGAVVMRVCRGLLGAVEAEDAWSETFLAALRAYPSLRPGSNVRGWLVTIAHNKAVDQLRLRLRTPVPAGEVGDRLVGNRPRPETAGGGPAGAVFADAVFDDTVVDDAAYDAAFADAAFADTPFADTPFADTPFADTPFADTAVADTAFADTAFADTAFADTAVADTAVADTVLADTRHRPPRLFADAELADTGLQSALAALPPKQRGAVVYRYLADLPYAEVAARLDCSQAAARRSASDGIARLRLLYGKDLSHEV